MNVLLDTHVWLWALLDPARLADAVRDTLAAPNTTRYLSPISVWETMVLTRRGRLRIAGSPAAWVGRALQQSRTTMVPVTHAIAVRSETLAGFAARDPADRFLTATALEHELTLITADEALLAFESLLTLAAR